MSFSLEDRLNERCADLRNPSTVNFSLSMYSLLSTSVIGVSLLIFHPSFILAGILVSYLPQHYRLISRRSSAGISPYFVLLGTTSGTCAFANILNIYDSRHALSCCKELSGFECAAALLGIAQIGIQWACFTVM